jgi:hypothetical protein
MATLTCQPRISDSARAGTRTRIDARRRVWPMKSALATVRAMTPKRFSRYS